jgi:hypothetical protein
LGPKLVTGSISGGLHPGATGAMTSVQIKGVPEQTHAVLRQRAALAHQSLQE